MNTKRGWLSGKSDDEANKPREEDEQLSAEQKRAAEEAGKAGGIPLPPGQVATTPVATEANPQISDDPTDPNYPAKKAWTGSGSVDLQKLWAWRKRVELGGPRQADWEEFDSIVRPEGQDRATLAEQRTVEQKRVQETRDQQVQDRERARDERQNR